MDESSKKIEIVRKLTSTGVYDSKKQSWNQPTGACIIKLFTAVIFIFP
jgi:hypothetical protein